MVVSDVTDTVYFQIIRGAEAAAAEAGYTIVLAVSQESGLIERSFVERAVSAVEGVVLTSSRMSDSAIRVLAKQRPTVVLNRAFPEVPCVVTDNARGMRRAVEHLTELGHDRLTYVAGPESSWADGMWWRSIREACPRAGADGVSPRSVPSDGGRRHSCGSGSLPRIEYGGGGL